MARRRGFFAELQHQAAVAERDRQRAQARAAREHDKAVRERERAHQAAVRAQQAARRADAKDRASAEREAKRLHVEAMEAEVEERNSQLSARLADIEALLESTLGIDDFVDLEGLRRMAQHPPFESKHQTPAPMPSPLAAPPEPVYVEPPAPTGLFGKKKKHAEAVEKARAEFDAEHAAWRAVAAAVPMKQLEQLQRHREAEEWRLDRLAMDQKLYDADCRKRQDEVDVENAELDDLIRRFQSGEAQAVTEYLGIVFANSVYPDDFDVEVDHAYDSSSRELRVDLLVPAPDQLPSERQFKYAKAKDEITATSQTQKEQKDRYNNMLNQVVLRTLHEVWESDRTGHVQSISLAGGVEHVHPATGRETFTPLIAVAVDREVFLDIDLARVTPSETLKHLGATVSRNAHGLVEIDTTAGVQAR